MGTAQRFPAEGQGVGRTRTRRAGGARSPKGNPTGFPCPCIAPGVGRRLGSGDHEGMDTNALFTMALGLQAPWEVKTLGFDAANRRLDISVDFKRGANFP